MAVKIGSQLISKLASPNSKIPMAVKDIFNCSGYTYFSYDAGGKIEGKDRLLDEAGTGAIWLLGIPAYNKLIDKTIYKAAKSSPEIDIRILRNNEIYKSALKNAPTQEILNELKIAGNNVSKIKNLAVIKFILSLGLTMLSYLGLTKFKQYLTKKNIEKEFLQKQLADTKVQKIDIKHNSPYVFKDFEDKKGTLSFGSAINVIEECMLNPIKNMMILDMGISGQRLATSRTKGEFREYAIKEGSFLFFVYGAGEIIKKGINKISKTVFNLPIELDAKILSSELPEEILNKKNLQKEIKEFGKIIKDQKNTNIIYDYILNNQENIVVKTAMTSGLIKTVKDTKNNIHIDTRKYINIQDIEKLIKDLTDLIDKSKGQNTTQYINKIKSLKVASTIINVAICCFTLGYLVPKYMYENRKKHQNGEKEFHVKKEYEKELAEKSLQTTLKSQTSMI